MTDRDARETVDSSYLAMMVRHVELSNKMHTREMKFFAALLGDGLFDTLKYARPNLVEIVHGIFVYSESDRMAIYKWEESTLPKKVFSAKARGSECDRVEIRCRCGRFFVEDWTDHGVMSSNWSRQTDVSKERNCGKCKA